MAYSTGIIAVDLARQHAAGAPQHVRCRGQHKEHHPELVLREPQVHVDPQLPIPSQRRRRAALQPPQLLFFATFVTKKLFKTKIKPYILEFFKLAFEHFCIHVSGRAVIDELEKNLHLQPLHVEASRMMLHRFGNTSSSSI
jgi:hypothetical protein